MSNPIISLIVILLSLGFAFFYVKPEYDLMQGHRTDLETLNAIASDANSINSLISQTKKTLDSVNTDERSRFDIFLPTTADPIRLADMLQHIGFKRGLILENIKVEDSANVVQNSAGGVAVNAVQGAVQGAVNIFTIGRKAELSQAAYDKATAGANTDASTTAGDKKYVTTKASFDLTATLPSFEFFLNNLETSLRLMNVVGLSFAPVPETADMKKTRTDAPPIYRYAVTIETYSLK